MITIRIKDKYAEVLNSFGELEEVTELALQRYTVEQISIKIAELRQKNVMYQAKYQMDYPAFTKRVAEDESFVKHIEENINKGWQIDLAGWRFCCKGIEDWMETLHMILLK
ncbi:MAG: hypothetical protein GY862_00970 [Gammaproteobacteria bacterium]|nr:hypothetical protein [Gammaproteobacteria bacterium]